MRLSFRDERRRTDVTVLHAAQLTLGQLGHDVGHPGTAYRIGQHVVTAATTLSALPVVDGSVIRTIDHADETPSFVPPHPDLTPAGTTPEPIATVRHVAGWTASGSLDLAPGDFILGRAPRPGLHADTPHDDRIHLRITGGGVRADAANGHQITVGGSRRFHDNARHQPIVANNAAFIVGDTTTQPPHVPARVVNRPPRERPASPVTPPPLPPRPATAVGKRALSIAMLVAPIPIGILMAFVLRPIYALFILMSPLMALAQWFEGRRRHRKDGVRFAKEITDALAHHGDAIALAATAEAARRRHVQPDIAQLRQWAAHGGDRLWERRPGHADYGTLTLGLATLTNPTPPPDGIDGFPEMQALYTSLPPLVDVPVTANLTTDRVIGIVGPRHLSEACARSLILQAATLHGPADLAIALCTEAHRLDTWDWMKWLPHLRLPGRRLRVSTDIDDTADCLELPGHDTDVTVWLPDGEARLEPPRLVALIDSTSLLHASASPLRAALGSPTSGITGVVLADRMDELPATCGAILEIDQRGTVQVLRPATNDHVRSVVPIGTSLDDSHDWARSLTRFSDPDATVGTSNVDDVVTLIDLVPHALDPDEILSAWRRRGASPNPAGPVGATTTGPLTIDLVADGPHGLIAGTTGSGKSELLRTMVASMALETSPDHLHFVLIDFKGGGAFDVCADLPHVVSIVTDLDDQLAERALRCLRAELRRREHALRSAGASDLPEFLRDGTQRLARLVVVIDEFATLAAELPDFLDALVDIAQRGRSLGVHLVLATQRPSGVLDAKVKANTNLRIALRVQDKADSNDVIGNERAADLSRRQPGRALARFGQAEITEFQTALVTAPHQDNAQLRARVSPFTLTSAITRADDADHAGEAAPAATDPVSTEREAGLAGAPNALDAPLTGAPLAEARLTEAALAQPAPDDPTDQPTDLDAVIDAVRTAFERGAYAEPASPWPDPLPTQVSRGDLLPFRNPDRTQPTALYGVVDRPDHQDRIGLHWHPELGSLALYSISNDDVTGTMTALAIDLAEHWRPDEVHLYAINMTGGALDQLGPLPHCGALVSAGDTERVRRLLTHLNDTIDRRLAAAIDSGHTARATTPGLDSGPHSGHGGPATLVFIDDFSALNETLEEQRDLTQITRLSRILRDGPNVGIHAVIGAAHERGIPNRIANLVPNRLVFRLADPGAYAAFGLRSRDVPTPLPRRAIDPSTTLLNQIVDTDDLIERVARLVDTYLPGAQQRHGWAPLVRVLDHSISLDAIDAHAASMTPDAWSLPIGTDATTLEPAHLVLNAGEHALVLGSAQSGKSTCLTTIAAAARRADPIIRIIAVALRRSPLRHSRDIDLLLGRTSDPARLLDLAEDHTTRTLILIDDLDLLTPPFADALTTVLDVDHNADERHVIGACRADTAKSVEPHIQALRRGRTGVFLAPAPGEGDALRTTLPLRRPERFPAGRGYIVNSTVPTMAQVARPPADALADERIEDTQAAIDRSPPADDSTAPAPLPTSPDGRYVIDLGLDGDSA